MLVFKAWTQYKEQPLRFFFCMTMKDLNVLQLVPRATLLSRQVDNREKCIYSNQHRENAWGVCGLGWMRCAVSDCVICICCLRWPSIFGIFRLHGNEHRVKKRKE